jgi:hypothetical protein
VEKYSRAGQGTVGNMARAHCMLDTQDYKYTHSGCVILVAFPLHQWLRGRALILLYTYIAWLFNPKFKFHYAMSSKFVKSWIV